LLRMFYKYPCFYHVNKERTPYWQRLSNTSCVFIIFCIFTMFLTLSLISFDRWDGIVAPLTKGVTAQYATNGEQKAPQRAMGFNGLNCITGAGRGKTTTWGEKWRDDIAIASNQTQRDLLDQQTNLHRIIIKEEISVIPSHIGVSIGALSTASRSKFCNGGGNFDRRLQVKIGTDSKNNVGAGRIKRSFQTKRFANNSLDSVTFGRPFELSVDTDSYSVISQIIGTENQTKALTASPFSFSINPVKLPALTKQSCFREFKPRQRYLSGETLTTFSTTGI